MIDGDGSGVNPRPGRVPEQELLTPETEFRMAAEHGGVFAIMTIFLGFTRRGLYMVQRRAPDWLRSGHAIGGRRPLDRALIWRGGCGSHQHLAFWLRESSGEISSTQFVSSNSENFGFLAFLQ